MSQYQYQFGDFALSDSGVHLLRSRFNYKTLRYDEITDATIKRTTEIKNAAVILVFGIALVGFAFFQGRMVIGLFNDPEVGHIYIESIVLPIIPAFLGIYCIYIGLRKGPVLILEEGGRKYKLRLRSAVKKGVADEFERYLNLRLGRRLVVAESMT